MLGIFKFKYTLQLNYFAVLHSSLTNWYYWIWSQR